MASVELDFENLHKPGIYLNMPEDEYHADPALGSTSIKTLCTKPWMFQYQRLRGSSNKLITEPMKFGAAFHCYILEGKEAFESRYSIKPSAGSFGELGKDVLVTVDHMKSFLRDKEQPTNYKSKATFIDAIREYCSGDLFTQDPPIIFEDKLQEWLEKELVEENYSLTERQLQEVHDGIYMLRQNSTTKAVMDTHSLVGGAPELSIFYEKNGIRCKNRYDFPLAPDPSNDRNFSMIIDFKVFSNFRGGDEEGAAMNTLSNMYYDIQAVYYMDGFEHAKELFKQGLIFGEEPSEGFIERLLTADEVRWAWVMVKRDDGFVPVIPWFKRDEEYLRDPFWQNAERALESAFEQYATYMEKFGDKVLWSPPEKIPPRVTFLEMPTYNRGLIL